MKATVIKSTGNLYKLRLDDGTLADGRIRGNLRLKGFEATNPLTVGDRVEVETAETTDQQYWITALEPRRNYIIRKAVKLSKQVQIIAANIDRAYIVATPVLPRTSMGFIDRFFSTAEAYAIPAGLIWNKCDIYDEDVWAYVEEVNELYSSIGYLTFSVSAQTGEGLDILKDHLKDKVNLFAGHSGVGKSSLINKLIPGLNLKTAKLSAQHLKGMHTTTFAEMHTLPSGGYLIDSPGIREFGTIDFDKYEVSHFFPEIFEVGKNCKFNNCLHTTESTCAVKQAVEEGRIAISRYESYLSILSGEDLYK